MGGGTSSEGVQGGGSGIFQKKSEMRMRTSDSSQTMFVDQKNLCQTLSEALGADFELYGFYEKCVVCKSLQKPKIADVMPDFSKSGPSPSEIFS